MSVDTPEELAGLKRAGRAVSATLREVARRVRPGVTTAELDAHAAQVFASHGARSAPALVYGFPGTICISVDDEAVHGIPGPRRLLRRRGGVGAGRPRVAAGHAHGRDRAGGAAPRAARRAGGRAAERDRRR